MDNLNKNKRILGPIDLAQKLFVVATLQILFETGRSSKAPPTKFAFGKNWTKSTE